MANVPHVFISSTVEDLQSHRSAARDAALCAGMQPLMQEYWASTDNRPLRECMARVDKADVFVAVVAYRYGWVPDDQPDSDRKSICRLECERAMQCDMELLVFLVDEDHDWDVKLK